MKDRLWFFGSAKYFDYNAHPAGAHYFATGAPGYTENKLNNLSGRLTWQATQKNKFTAFIDKNFKTQVNTAVFTLGAGNTPNVDWATAVSDNNPSNNQMGYVKWTSTASQRLLLEAGWGFNIFNTAYNNGLPGQVQQRGSAAWYAAAPHQDLVLGTLTGGCCATTVFALQPTYTGSGSVTYTTGSHNVKVGIQYRDVLYSTKGWGFNGDLLQQYRSGVPSSVLAEPTPYISGQFAHELGPYAMDTWTIHRLALSLGLRFDSLTGGTQAQDLPAGRFVPARNVPELHPFNRFNNFEPRLGVVYDLFGDAKTALKFSASKYLTQYSAINFLGFNPISSTGDTRTWLDCDLVPGTSLCSGRVLPTNLDGIAQDNEIGPSNNPLFGTAVAATPDPNLKREYTWDYAASVQRELFPGVSVMGGWYYTRSYDAQVTINNAVSFASYTPVVTTNPTNGASLTVFNLNPSFQGKVANVVRNSSTNHRDYNSFELGLNARFGQGGTLMGGWAMERNRTVSCDTTNPNLLLYCDQTGNLPESVGAVSIPYRHEFKLAGSYLLPAKVQAGVSLLSYPGLPLTVNYVVPLAILPNRSAPVTVPVIAPGASYLPRWNQLDVHFTREIKVGRLGFRPTFEVFNLNNSAAILGQNQTFGPTLGQPLSTLQGRLMKLSVLVKF
jgi:hypothetical protein